MSLEQYPELPSRNIRRRIRSRESVAAPTFREQCGIPDGFTEEVISGKSSERVAELVEFWSVFDKLFFASEGMIREYASLAMPQVPEIFESYLSVLSKIRKKEDQPNGQFNCYWRHAEHIKKSSFDNEILADALNLPVPDVLRINGQLHLHLDPKTHTYTKAGQVPLSSNAYDLSHTAILSPRVRVNTAEKNFSTGGEVSGDSVIHIEYGNASIDAVFDAITNNDRKLKDTDLISSRWVSRAFVLLLPEFLRTHPMQTLSESDVKDFIISVHDWLRANGPDGMEIRATGVVSFHCGDRILVLRWGDAEFSLCVEDDKGEIHAFLPPPNTTGLFDEPSLRDSQIPDMVIEEASKEFYLTRYQAYLDESYPVKFNCPDGIGSIGTAGDFASKVETYTLRVPKNNKYTLMLYSDGAYEYGDRLGIEQPWVMGLFMQSMFANAEIPNTTWEFDRAAERIIALVLRLRDQKNFRYKHWNATGGKTDIDTFAKLADPYIASRSPWAVLVSIILTRMVSGVAHPNHQNRGKLDDLGMNFVNSRVFPELAAVRHATMERMRILSQRNVLMQHDIASMVHHVSAMLQRAVEESVQKYN